MSRVLLQLALLGTVLLCFLSVHALARTSANCDEELGEYVNCHTCVADDSYSSNDVAGLPRISQGGMVSSQLGFYDNFADLQSDQTYYAETAPMHYVTGVASIAAIMIFMSLFAVCSGCVFGCCRVCCNSCGKSHPTLKGPHATFSLGFVRDEEDMYGFAYSKQERWGSRIFTSIFAFFVVLWICMGQWNGNDMLPEAAKAVLDSPTALMEAVQSLSPPVEEFFLNTLGGPVREMLLNVDHLFFTTLNVPGLRSNLTCILDAFEELPDSTAFEQAIYTTQNQSLDIAEDVNATNRGVPEYNTMVLTALAAFNVSLWEIQGSTSDFVGAIDTSLEYMTDFEANDIDDLAATARAINVSLQALQQEWPDVGLPVETDIDAATGGGYGSLQNIQAVTTTDLAERISIRDVMLDIQAALNSLPDFVTTADNMVQLNNRTNTFLSALDTYNAGYHQTDYNLFHRLEEMVNATTVLMGDFRLFTDNFTSNYDTLNDVLIDFSFDDLRADILDMNATTNNITFDGLYEEMDKVGSLNAISPCLDAINVQFDKVNTTLFAMSDAMATVYELQDTVGSAAAEMEVSNDEARDNIGTFQATQNDTLVRIQLASIDVMEAAYILAHSNLDGVVDIFVPAMTDIVVAAEQINITMLENWQNFNATLADNRIASGTIDQLRTFGDLIAGLKQRVDMTVEDLSVLAAGTCSEDGVTVCTADGDCTGTCNPQPVVCKDDTGTNCAGTGDVTCSNPGDRCLVDDDRLEGIIGNLTSSLRLSTMFDVSVPQLSAITISTDLSSFSSAVWSNSLTAVQTSVEALAFGTVSDAAEAVEDSFDLYDPDFTVLYFDTIVDALLAIDWADSLAGVDSVADATNSTLQSAGSVNVSVAMCDSMLEFHNYKLPEWMAVTEEDNLRVIRANGDVSDVFYTLVNLVDNMTLWLNESQSDPENLANFATNYTFDSVDARSSVQAIATDEQSQYGPIHFFAYISGPSAVLDPADPKAHRVWVDAKNEDYTEAKTCYSRTCLDAEVEALHKEPIASSPISMRNAIALPYLPVVLVALVAVLTMVVPKMHSWNFCNCCCMFVIMPFAFSLGGILFTTFAVIPADICLGMENVGYKTLFVSPEEGFCSSRNYTGVDGKCEVEVASLLSFDNSTTEDANATAAIIEVDFAGIYSSILGDSCSSTFDPVEDLWQDMSNTSVSVVETFNPILLATLQSFEVREPLQNVFENATAGIGVELGVLLADVGSVLGCNAFSSVYQGFKQAFCCDVLSAFYWAFGSWCLIAWTFYCCGWPSAVLGAKRFAPRPWGIDFTNARMDAHHEGDPMKLLNVSAGVDTSSDDSRDEWAERTVDYTDKREVKQQHQQHYTKPLQPLELDVFASAKEKASGPDDDSVLFNSRMDKAANANATAHAEGFDTEDPLNELEDQVQMGIASSKADVHPDHQSTHDTNPPAANPPLHVFSTDAMKGAGFV